MEKKIKIALLLIIAGWLLGYVHQHMVANTTIFTVEQRASLLEQELAEMKMNPPIAAKVSVKATAYSNDEYSINVSRWRDGRTATNKVVRRGYVAADWSVFPPGTRLYIPGYGEAVVEDRGGAVKGLHLDLFVDTRDEALRWGVKKMEVFVLEKGKGGHES